MSSIKLYELWFEIMVAIGGPKTNQHVKAKNKSFKTTKTGVYILFQECNFVPMKYSLETHL